jgi:hypothetical protein
MGLPYREPTERAQFEIDSFGYILYFYANAILYFYANAHTISILG